MESYLRRKGITERKLDTRSFQEIAHEIFIELSDYSVKELAFFLGEDAPVTYKFLEGVRPIRVDWARRVVQFIGLQNPEDTRLADFFCSAGGFLAMPALVGMDRKKVRAVLMAAHDVTKT